MNTRDNRSAGLLAYETGKTVRALLLSASAMLLGTIFATTAWGGGIAIYEMGTPDTGTAIAGRAALGEDASTAMLNPAAMTRLQQSQLLVGLQPMVFDAKFNSASDTQLVPPGIPQGGDGGNAIGLVVAGGAFYVYSVNDDLKLGAGFGSYAGGALQYEDDWVGRYYNQQAEFLTLAFNPTVAYRIADWLSVGGGPMLLWGQVRQRAAINNALPERDAAYPDGQLDFKDDGFAPGGNIGLFSEPIAGTRLGLQYFTPVNFTFKDSGISSGLGPVLTRRLQATGLLDGTVDMDVTIPQMLMVSAYHQLTDTVAIMGNFGWQQWSQFGLPEISLTGENAKSFTADLDYSDTYHGALGVHYRIAEPWLLTAGFAYDSSPLTATHRSPALPLDRQMRIALGARHDVSESVTIGAQFEYLHLFSSNIQRENPLQGRLHGDYSPNFGLIASLTIAVR
ncbi:MAG: OmpP1/FadL family transporter [Candidatus Binatia bacterium]